MLRRFLGGVTDVGTAGLSVRVSSLNQLKNPDSVCDVP